MLRIENMVYEKIYQILGLWTFGSIIVKKKTVKIFLKKDKFCLHVKYTYLFVTWTKCLIYNWKECIPVIITTVKSWITVHNMLY